VKTAAGVRDGSAGFVPRNCGTIFLSSALEIGQLAMEENAMKKIALITAALAVLAIPVLAEDAKTTGTAPADAKFSTVSKDEMFSSKVKGLNVYNQKDESIGEITDLAIKNHQVDALILSVGGFLGMGEHYVAVSPSSVNIRYDSKNDKWLASMSTTKEALKAAPEFKYPK
jgi:PRC-barrel domain